MLSLGPTHSFPLEDVKGFLKSATAEDVLVQALLDAPVFATRWRWDAAIALALVRNRNGKRMPAPFQRADSEDLLTVVFPDQVACAENLTGPREIPDHPLVKQAIDDCLREFMDVDGFLALLKRIEDGGIEVQCLDLSAPSPLSHAVLGARPYAFLDDGDAEGRRTRSITTDRLLDPKDAADLGRLDPEAIKRVKAEAWPEIGKHDELHDALVVYGFLTAPEIEPWKAQLAQLRDERRVMYHDGLWVAVERSAEFERAKSGSTRGARRDPAQPPRAGGAGDGSDAQRRRRHAGQPGLRRVARARSAGFSHARPIQRRARGRMVRAAPIDPHPPLHPRPQAQRHPGRAAGAVHALPVPLAAGGDGGARREAGRRSWIAGGASAARRLCSSGRCLGAGHPPPADEAIPTGMLDKLCAAGRIAWLRRPEGSAAEEGGPPVRCARRRSCWSGGSR